jgi:hypothetical protein
MEIIVRHYKTLRTSYNGSQSLQRDTKVYNNNVYNETKKPQDIHFLTLKLNLGRVLNINIHKFG